MPDFTSFGGVAIGPSTPYDAKILYGSDAAFTSAPELRTGVGRVPVRDAIRYGGRDIPFSVFRGVSGVSDAQWQQDVYQTFAPQKGARPLAATHNGLNLTLTVDVGSLRRVHDRVFEGTFVCSDPVWRTTTTTTTSTSPVTVVGTVAALPTLTLTPTTTTLNRRRVTITDVTGRGLVNYPTRITFDSTGVGATATSNYIVFSNGRPVPIFIQAPNTATTKLDVRLDIPPGATGAYIDLYYGSTVANTITAQAYDQAGMDITHASYSATQWVWKANEFDVIGTRPAATGVWRYGTLDRYLAGWSYQLVPSSQTALQFNVINGNDYSNNADSLVMMLGVDAGNTDALQGISMVNNGPSGRVRYRKAGETLWRTAVATLIAGFPTVPNQYKYDLDGAVEIALSGPANTASTIQADGNTPWRLALLNTPTVSVGAATTARYVNGVFTNSTTGATISLTDLYVDNVALAINCLARTIAPASGPLYGAISFSDPVDWLPLAVGSNAWTAPANTTASLEWASRYVV